MKKSRSQGYMPPSWPGSQGHVGTVVTCKQIKRMRRQTKILLPAFLKHILQIIS